MKNQNPNYAKVVSIIAEDLLESEETIMNSENLRTDAGMDSLDEISIVMKIESDFSITIPDEDYGNITTVEGFVNLIPLQYE